MTVLRDILKPLAPITGTQVVAKTQRLITPREAMDRMTESPFSFDPGHPAERGGSFPTNAPTNRPTDQPTTFVEDETLDHFAELHRYGRKPHAEIISGLLDNFYIDGNQAHLDQALTFLEHLRSL